MTITGAILFACAVASVVLAVRGQSRVERLLHSSLGMPTVVGAVRRRVAPHVDVLAAAAITADVVMMPKTAACAAGSLGGSVVALILGAGPLPLVLGAYGGFIVPSLVVEHRAAMRRGEAERATVVLVERLHALVSAGRPLESACLGLAESATSAPLVASILDATRRDYLLGSTLHEALDRNASRAGARGLVLLAERIAHARALGRGAATVLADLRDELRESERRRSLAAASQVEGKLTLVLTLCYLPALALLVVVPLFLTLLSALSR